MIGDEGIGSTALCLGAPDITAIISVLEAIQSVGKAHPLAIITVCPKTHHHPVHLLSFPSRLMLDINEHMYQK